MSEEAGQVLDFTKRGIGTRFLQTMISEVRQERKGSPYFNAEGVYSFATLIRSSGATYWVLRKILEKGSEKGSVESGNEQGTAAEL